MTLLLFLVRCVRIAADDTNHDHFQPEIYSAPFTYLLLLSRWFASASRLRYLLTSVEANRIIAWVLWLATTLLFYYDAVALPLGAPLDFWLGPVLCIILMLAIKLVDPLFSPPNDQH